MLILPSGSTAKELIPPPQMYTCSLCLAEGTAQLVFLYKLLHPSTRSGSCRSSSTMSSGVSRTASGLCEQSIRALIMESNLNSSPSSSSANRCMSQISCLLIVTPTVLSLSGKRRSISSRMPFRHRS